MHKLNKLVLLHAIGWYMLSATGCQKEELGYKDTITPQRIPIEIQMYDYSYIGYGDCTLAIRCTPFDVCDFTLDTYASIEAYNLDEEEKLSTAAFPFPSYTTYLLPKPEYANFDPDYEVPTSSMVRVPVLFIYNTKTERNLNFSIRFYQPSTNICYISQPFQMHIYKGKDGDWHNEIKSAK